MLDNQRHCVCSYLYGVSQWCYPMVLPNGVTIVWQLNIQLVIGVVLPLRPSHSAELRVARPWPTNALKGGTTGREYYRGYRRGFSPRKPMPRNACNRFSFWCPERRYDWKGILPRI